MDLIPHCAHISGVLADNNELPLKAAFVFPDVLALDLFVLSAVPHPHLLCCAENLTPFGLVSQPPKSTASRLGSDLGKDLAGDWGCT